MPVLVRLEWSKGLKLLLGDSQTKIAEVGELVGAIVNPQWLKGLRLLLRGPRPDVCLVVKGKLAPGRSGQRVSLFSKHTHSLSNRKHLGGFNSFRPADSALFVSAPAQYVCRIPHNSVG